MADGFIPSAILTGTVEDALALQRAGDHHAALRIYDALIRGGSASAQVWRGAGNALLKFHEYAQARRAFQESLAAQPEDAESQHGLATALFSLGDVDGAVARMEPVARSTGSLPSWLALATMIPGCTGASLGKIRRIREEFAARLRASVAPAEIALRPAYRARQDAPLRIGYLSAFFDQPNYMKPVWGLINQHDRRRFEIHLFSDAALSPAWPGYEPQPLDQLHHSGEWDNATLAEAIRRNKIDVLVDLNGYSASRRLALFLGVPAPVNVAWFNMYATSGLPGFDYVVGDGEVAPPAEDHCFAEKVWRLPLSYLTFAVQQEAPPVVPPPCLTRGFFTFGSLAAQYKLTSATLDAWSAILLRVPKARLLLANHALAKEENCGYVVEQFAARGVEPACVDLRPPAEHLAYLRYYDEIDVALDTFPYNGGTTTMEAIWQGVPVLTVQGDRWAARTSQSILRRTHLSSFVTGSVVEMQHRAVELALDPHGPRRLRKIREITREQLRCSQACDTVALARAVEEFYSAVARGASGSTGSNLA